jgi:hypothetical protein
VLRYVNWLALLVAVATPGCGAGSTDDELPVVRPEPLRGTGSGWRITPFSDVTLIEARPLAFQRVGGGLLGDSSICLAGDLPGVGWSGVQMRDDNADGWFEFEVDNRAALLGLDARPGCARRLPYRFSLKVCGSQDDRDWALLNEGNTGTLFWFGDDDRCVCTGSAALYWQPDNGYPAPGGIASEPC